MSKIENPYISIIIPVFQEEGRICETLDTIEALDNKFDAEVIVVDGDREAKTIHAISGFPVKTITAPRGRSAQMNAGADLAQGEVLLFLHADTQPPKDALPLIRRTFMKRSISAGAFDLGINAPGFAYRAIEWMVYWRSRLTRIPYGDQAIFIRQSIFHALGGYREIPIMEDIDLMRRVKRSGVRIEIIGRKAWTSARRWEKEGLVACTLRNWLLSSAFYLGVSPDKLTKYYP